MYRQFKFIANAFIVGLAFYFHRYTVPFFGWLALLMTTFNFIKIYLPKSEKQLIPWDDIDWSSDCECDKTLCGCKKDENNDLKEL
jgi:hypothetical protein